MIFEAVDVCKHKDGLFLFYTATASRWKEVGYIVRLGKPITVDWK